MLVHESLCPVGTAGSDFAELHAQFNDTHLLQKSRNTGRRLP